MQIASGNCVESIIWLNYSWCAKSLHWVFYISSLSVKRKLQNWEFRYRENENRKFKSGESPSAESFFISLNLYILTASFFLISLFHGQNCMRTQISRKTIIAGYIVYYSILLFHRCYTEKLLQYTESKLHLCLF